MSGNMRSASAVFLLAFAILSVSGRATAQAGLTANEIADKSVAASGGQREWRAIRTMVMTGKMEAGGNDRAALPTQSARPGRVMPAKRPAEQVRLPFVMKMARPRKTRLEIEFRGQKAVQVFDGSNGWKLRPYLNRNDVEPYTAQELKTVSRQTDLDGPLVDYAAKGETVQLIGTEKVEGRNTYKLKLTPRSGEAVTLWIDSATFLVTKQEGAPRLFDGTYHPVEVYYRDYRVLGPLKIPYEIETRLLNAAPAPGSGTAQTVTEKILIDKVDVNEKLDDALFTKAQLVAVAGAQQPRNTATPVPAKLQVH